MGHQTLPVFTPTAADPIELDARTVGRDAAIERVLASVRAAADGGDRPHMLIVGPRGSGKTHLLAVVRHRIAQDEGLSERLAVVSVPEDAVDITSYEDLLVAVLEQLIDSAAASQEQGTENLVRARELRMARDKLGLEHHVLALLDDQTLVLVIENLDRVFADLGNEGQSRLRSLAETSGRLLLLASTPLLFGGVSDYGRPWYGSFDVEHLGELSVRDGRRLLQHVARSQEDVRLEAFLGTPEAEARLLAVAQLAGGSPRIWMVLASCMTVELLDELVPLVTEMLDELVPYYQARLNELAGVERKLVIELCRTSVVSSAGRVVHQQAGMRTVKDLADACGLDQRVAATALKRLLDSRWVRKAKPAGVDRRTTWYEVREPLLRHYLQYRETRGEPLRVIVSFLRAWFSITEQRRRLARASPGSVAERYLTNTVASDVALRQSWPGGEGASLEGLLVVARARLADALAQQDTWLSARAAVVFEAMVLGASEGTGEARRVAEERAERLEEPSVALSAVEEGLRAIDQARRDPVAHSIHQLLVVGFVAVRASSALSSVDAIAIGLVVAGWRRAMGEYASALRELTELTLDARSLGPEGAGLRLAVEAERAAIMRQVGDEVEAQRLAAVVLNERSQLLGDDHPDTLASRRELARGADSDEAVPLLDELAHDYARIFGPEHPGTMAVRFEALERRGLDATLRSWQTLVRDLRRVAPEGDQQLLRARSKLALIRGVSDASESLDVSVERFEALISDAGRRYGFGGTLAMQLDRMTLIQRKAGASYAAADLDAFLAQAASEDLSPEVRTSLETSFAVLLAADGQSERALDLVVRLWSDDPAKPLARGNVQTLAVLFQQEGVARHVLADLGRYERIIEQALVRVDDAGSLFLGLVAEVSRVGPGERERAIDWIVRLANDSNVVDWLTTALIVETPSPATQERWLTALSATAHGRSLLPVLAALFAWENGDETALLALPPEARRVTESIIGKVNPGKKRPDPAIP